MTARDVIAVTDLQARAGPAPTRLVLATLAGAGLVAAVFAVDGDTTAGRMLAVAGLTLVLLSALTWWRAVRRDRSRRQAIALLAGFIETDSVSSFVTDDDGAVVARNPAAAMRFGGGRGGTLASALRSVFANPAAVLYRLQCRARADGSAREEVVTRRGQVRLAVHRLAGHGYLWRVEDSADRAGMARAAQTFPVPMLTVGRSGAILFMNEAAREVIGARPKALDRLFVALPPRPGAVNALSTKTGQRDVLLAEQRLTAGRTELYFLPFEAAAMPGQSAALDSLPVPMLKLDPAGTILEVNRQAAEMLGSEVTAGAGLEQVMQGLGLPVADWLRDTLEEAEPLRAQYLRLVPGDKERFVQVTLTRATEEGRTVLIAVLSDATELKSLEAQFVQSQKMQAIGQLAGGVAHDFNNLLTAISGHCDLLLLRHDQSDQDYGDLVQINENANRAAALVSQLLAFSRKQTLRPEVLDMRDTLSDLIHLLNRLVGEKVTLTLSHDPVLRPIRADKRQLEQVLMNLVVNARDAMPSGGEIRIETEVVTLERDLKRDRATVPAGDYVVVRVCDEGVGIPADTLPKIFEPFYTTKRTGEGTGLGLSTAYGIVKQTGGFIFVDSVPNGGTQFTLYFPVFDAAEPEPAPVAVVPAPVAGRQGEGVVLLVEDEAPVRAFASRALRLRGYTVIEAGSAEEALDMLKDADLRVDVFVTDVVMPGMDGPSWVRRALKNRPGVRVVFMSGYAEDAFGDSGPDVPGAAFLPKPFSLNQLTSTVHRQMH